MDCNLEKLVQRFKIKLLSCEMTWNDYCFHLDLEFQVWEKVTELPFL